jgi:ubiquinone/menaquinone biosynthesis C-methylase UbiE
VRQRFHWTRRTDTVLPVDDSVEMVATGYDAFYSTWANSPALSALWREHATGPDFPDEFRHISFLRLAELRLMRDALDLQPGSAFADLACGAGGPGLWVARESGAQLTGIDVSDVAVRCATERARHLVVLAATFRQGTFEQTGLDAASVDGVMSVDAIQYAPEIAPAFTEIRRILRPGGRLAFAAFELDAGHVAGLPVWRDPVSDYRPLLERVGFEVLRYEQLAGWYEQVMATFTAIIDARQELEAELGTAAAGALIAEASITIELQPYIGHVLCVARRPLPV